MTGITGNKEIDQLWSAYEAHKERAEQHEFVRLLMLDMRLIPLHDDLVSHYTEKHAALFKRILIQVLEELDRLALEDTARMFGFSSYEEYKKARARS